LLVVFVIMFKLILTIIITKKRESGELKFKVKIWSDESQLDLSSLKAFIGQST